MIMDGNQLITFQLEFAHQSRMKIAANWSQITGVLASAGDDVSQIILVCTHLRTVVFEDSQTYSV